MSRRFKKGDVLEGYELGELLGEGGMGAVFAATHQRLGRRVALKILSKELSASDDYVSRFLHEAKIVNDVRHPNIVDITDFLETAGEPRCVAYVMEFIEGPTLGQVLRKHRLSVIQAVNIMHQVASALAAVHRLHVVHRDLKPDNILVLSPLDSDFSRTPAVKVLDFGIAKVESPDRAHKTATGLMLGTPAYMAPEQIAAEPVSPATDVYALGELLYEIVTGRRAFQGESMKIFRAKLVGSLPPLPLPENCEGGPELLELVKRCIQVEQTDRPSTEAFLAELDAIKAVAVQGGGVAHTVTQPSMAGQVLSPTPQPTPSMPKSHAPIPHAEPTPVAMASMVAESPEFTEVKRPPATLALLGLAFAVLALVTVLGLRVLRQDGAVEVQTMPLAAPPVEAPAEPQPPPEPEPEPAPAVEPAPEPPPPEPVPAKPKKSYRKTVKISSSPRGADVFDAVSGAKLGTTPVKIRLERPDEVRKLRVEKNGYTSTTIDVDASQRSMKVALAKLAEPPRIKPTNKPVDPATPIKKRKLKEW